MFPNSLFRAYVAAIPALNREFGNNLMCHPVHLPPVHWLTVDRPRICCQLLSSPPGGWPVCHAHCSIDFRTVLCYINVPSPPLPSPPRLSGNLPPPKVVLSIARSSHCDWLKRRDERLRKGSTLPVLFSHQGLIWPSNNAPFAAPVYISGPTPDLIGTAAALGGSDN